MATGNMYRKLREVWTRWFLRYASGQMETDRHTYRLNTLHPYWGKLMAIHLDIHNGSVH